MHSPWDFEAIELDTCRQLFRAWDPRFGRVEGLRGPQPKDLERKWMHGHVCIHTHIYIYKLCLYNLYIYILYIDIKVNSIKWYAVIWGFKASANRLLRVPLKFCCWLPSLVEPIASANWGWRWSLESVPQNLKVENWWTLTVGYWTCTCNLCKIIVYTIYIHLCIHMDRWDIHMGSVLKRHRFAFHPANRITFT